MCLLFLPTAESGDNPLSVPRSCLLSKVTEGGSSDQVFSMLRLISRLLEPISRGPSRRLHRLSGEVEERRYGHRTKTDLWSMALTRVRTVQLPLGRKASLSPKDKAHLCYLVPCPPSHCLSPCSPPQTKGSCWCLLIPPAPVSTRLSFMDISWSLGFSWLVSPW